MIYVILLAAVVVASLGVFAVLLRKIGKLEDMLISTSLEVAHLKDSADEFAVTAEHLEARVKDVEGAMENIEDSISEGELAKTLERKWEDAVQVISNFDPFRIGEDK